MVRNTTVRRWINTNVYKEMGFQGGTSGKEPTCQCRRCGFDPWIGKIPWRMKWQPTPVFLPREFHGQTRLAGYNPWDHKRVIHDLATKQQQDQLKISNAATKMGDPVCLR